MSSGPIVSAPKIRVLYVDPICPAGHVTLNRVYIERLVDAGFAVDVVLKEGYAEQIGIPTGVGRHPASAEYFGEHHGRIRSRWNQLRLLRMLRRTLPLDKYDLVFFSSYEEVSFYLAAFPGHPILVNHANVAALDQPIKRWFIKRIARRATFVVFHEFIRDRLREDGILRVRVHPLGLTRPYVVAESTKKAALAAIDPRLVSDRWAQMVFVPTGAKYGSPFVGELLRKEEVLQYLEERRILLVVKDRALRSPSENVLVLAEQVPSDWYQALFCAATCVLICYPRTFTYRVSALLFECFSNGKACLVSDIEAFRAFEVHFRYSPFFSDPADLMRRLDDLLKVPQLLRNPYLKLEELMPSFADLAGTNHGT